MRAPIDIKKPGIYPYPRPDLKTQVEFNFKDKNGNGELTSDEYGVGKETQDEFRRYDSNNDGKLSIDEFRRGRQLDAFRDRIEFHKPMNGKLEKAADAAKGAGETKEEPSFFKKALPWLALANPITAPIGLFSLAKKFFSKD